MEIKSYAPKLEQEHIRFAKKYWPTKKRRSIPEYIYWKFRGNPQEDLQSFIVAVEEDKVVGQFGIIPCQVRIEDKVYDAQWACDLMVDNSLRGKGIASQLYQKAHDTKPVTLGSNPSPAAEKSMVRSGYTVLNGPRKFIYPVNLNEILKLKTKGVRTLDKVGNPFNLLLKFVRNGNFQKISATEYFNLRTIDNGNFVSCHYNRDFQQWRFSPFKNYYQGIQCYKLNSKNHFSGYAHQGIYYLTDFHASSILSFLRLIKFILKENKDLKKIRLVSNQDIISRKLAFFGFVKFRTLTKIVLFTKDEEIKRKVANKKFYYTYFDSDEML